jgi:hypothetical protein
MLTKTKVALSVAIVLGTASGAFARNQGSIYTDPDSTPNGPFFYVNTYGVPPSVPRPVHEPRRLPSKHH